MNLNKVTFAGNIGRMKPSAMPDGTAVVNIRIASTKRYKDRNSGERQEKTTWMTAAAFGRQAEVIQQYFQKGDPIYIEGALDVRDWEDQQGNKRQSVEIRILDFQFVGSNPTGQQQGQPPHAPQQPVPAQAPQPPQDSAVDPFDDDLPF